VASQEMKDVFAMMFAQRAEAAGARKASVEELRASFDLLLAAMPPVAGGVIAPVDAGGVPAEWTTPESGAATRGTLLYLHGGGYFEGSPTTHRRLVTALCLASGVRGLSVDYRLAPEHPFPAAVDDAVSAYRWLVREGGEEPSRVVVAGDSAGGGLSAALLVALRDAGDPLPAGAYLLSAWTDLAGTGESMRSRADADPMIDPRDMPATAARYVPDGDLRNPHASPLYADLAGLPPLLIHVGDAEVLLDDSRRLAERAAAAGVAVECEIWPDAFHVFQMLVGMVPEADEAVAQAAAWITKRLAAG
jgi:epsilon-lactone hydrolase